MAEAAWGVRNDTVPRDELIEGGFVSIGWDDQITDLTGLDRPQIRALVAATYDVSPRVLGNWVGQLSRFVNEMQVGDFVVAPVHGTSLIDVGRVAGDYAFHGDEPVHRHRRAVTWHATGLPREPLPSKLRVALRSRLTVFSIAAVSTVTELLRAIDPEDVRALLWEVAERISRETGFEASSYQKAASDRDPVASLRRILGPGPADPTFQELHRRDLLHLTVEDAVVRDGQRIGLSEQEILNARGRLDYWASR